MIHCRFNRGEHDKRQTKIDNQGIAVKGSSKAGAKTHVPLLPELTNNQQGLSQDRHAWLATAAAMQGLWP